MATTLAVVVTPFSTASKNKKMQILYYETNWENTENVHAPAALFVCVTTPWATVFVPCTVARAALCAPEATVPPTERARALKEIDK